MLCYVYIMTPNLQEKNPKQEWKKEHNESYPMSLFSYLFLDIHAITKHMLYNWLKIVIKPYHTHIQPRKKKKIPVSNYLLVSPNTMAKFVPTHFVESDI